MVPHLDLIEASGLRQSIRRHVGLKEGGRSWTDDQFLTSLLLLNLAGGESVADLRVLEGDEGESSTPREAQRRIRSSGVALGAERCLAGTMPRPGGEADKFGNRYEALWTVDAALDLIDGEWASLTVEQVGDEAAGVEFVRTNNAGSNEYHSIKRGAAICKSFSGGQAILSA